MKRCKDYCGVSCIDGSCPMANRDEYIERGYDVVKNCKDCHYYKGCKDCYFAGRDKSDPLYCSSELKGENNE